MRTPAQAWQRPSVGSCCPSEITHGQKTVQLHERTKSPLSFQLSLSATCCSYPARVGQCAITELAMKTAPTAMKTIPNARENRVLVLIFSIVMMAPSAAIQTTFITPTANISSIIAQQQPRQ